MAKDSPFDYALKRYHETKQHYFVTELGQAMLDCAHNRKILKEMEIAIVFSTRHDSLT
jgi:hypothetical protein